MKQPSQTASTLLMVRPATFGFNEQTGVSNHFQQRAASADPNTAAQQEFDRLVAALRAKNIEVKVVQDTAEPVTPDAIFPNNWVSFHPGMMCLYPMAAPNRRDERKAPLIAELKKDFNIDSVRDFSALESTGDFLEGTGSLVLDRVGKVAYACLSPRTTLPALQEFASRMGYRIIAFHAVDDSGRAIYHTNVMMTVADEYAVVCLESIRSPQERSVVEASLVSAGKEIIPITPEQMNNFAGNLLQVSNRDDERFLAMSSRAYAAFTPEQLSKLESFQPIIHSPLDTIETLGGGSARCMICEVNN